VTVPHISLGTRTFWVIDGITVDAQSYWQTGVGSGGGNNTFKNMEVKNAVLHGFLGGGNNSKWQFNSIHDNATSSCSICSGCCYGIYWDGDNVLIEGNKIFNNTNGYGSQASVTHTGGIFRNNVYNNNNSGFETYGSNHLVNNNISYNNSYGGYIC